jgi:hypothetical protein
LGSGAARGRSAVELASQGGDLSRMIIHMGLFETSTKPLGFQAVYRVFVMIYLNTQVIVVIVIIHLKLDEKIISGAL